MLCANLRVGMEVGGGIISPRSSRAKAPESPRPSGSTLLLDKKAMLAAHTSSCFFPSPPPQGVLNFVQYKFSHLAPRERQTMFELSKMFLLCLNYWKLETPAQFRQRSQAEDVATYKVNYTR